MQPARILLADDHRGMLETVKRMLADDFNVVGTVENGEQAVKAVAILNPDIVILDIVMPGMSGIEAAAHLRKSGFAGKLIFLTGHAQADFVTAAFSAGALAYVVKARVIPDLTDAIREVLAGRAFTSRSSDVRPPSLPPD